MNEEKGQRKKEIKLQIKGYHKKKAVIKLYAH